MQAILQAIPHLPVLKKLIVLLWLTISIQLYGQDYTPVPGKIMSKWAEQVSPENAWQEYPRPQMVRKSWTNLNGLWKFAITKKTAAKPEELNGEILVPFALETPLSGWRTWAFGLILPTAIRRSEWLPVTT